MSVRIHGKDVALRLAKSYALNGAAAQETLKQVRECRPLHDWVHRMDQQQELTVNSIEVQHVDFFGPRVGFVKFRADVRTAEGVSVPSIVFLRGPSVGVLMVLECEGKSYALLCVQPRIPAGSFAFVEIPAGMVDGEGNFVGKAAAEVREETGIEIKESDLLDITKLTYGDAHPGVYPSPGGSDEHISLFLYRTEVTPEQLQEWDGRFTGLREEGELITLRIMPLEDVWRECADAKTLCAIHLFEELKKSGKVPKTTVRGEGGKK